MELIAVVLKSPTGEQRVTDARTLLDHGFANYALVQPDLADTGSVPVTLGKCNQVSPMLGDQASLLIDKGQKSNITTEVVLEESLTAPVSLGQRIGTMTVKSGDQILKEILTVLLLGVSHLPKMSFETL